VYFALKAVHVSTVCISITLFLIRSYSVFTDRVWHRVKLLRVVPHVNDTLLLLSALGLVMVLRQYPFVEPWLTTKLVLLILYVALGMGVMRFAKSRMQRFVLFTLALLCFAAIVAVALGHNTLMYA
jgi:uncharacterized membrane protein SirB2